MTALQENFHLLNSRYFGGRLKNVTVKWKRWPKNHHRMATTWSSHGSVPRKQRKCRIEIDMALKKYPRVVLQTLIHELVHVQQWGQTTSKTRHGRLFNKRMKQLAAKGAFNGLW